jgi:predicted tellurium resistance membrane protein TerC
MAWITDPQQWIALVTLTVLEIVLGVDNVIFISILSGKLPSAVRDRARRLGLGAAMLTRIALLLSLTWLMRLTGPLFTVPWIGHAMSLRDLILLAGGLFLLAKATYEIHERLEGPEGQGSARAAATFAGVVVQIMLLDIVFSIDSVITAVGMARSVGVMVTAIVLAVVFMMWFSGPVSRLVEQHPTIRMLALSFLLLIGVNLVADSLGQHIARGYVYFAMGFSVFVEALNIRVRPRAEPLHLRQPYVETRGWGLGVGG